MTLGHQFEKPPRIYPIQEATVDPFADGNRRGACRPAGIYNSSGKYVKLGHCLRRDGMPITSRPPKGMPEGDFRRLEGRWLFGGMLYQHFGHFLLESTSRLWAVDHIDTQIDGVLFLPRKKLTWERRYVVPIIPWLQYFGEEFTAVEAPTSPVHVEELIVPQQAFGAGSMMAGSEEYRDFVHRRLGKEISADGAERIYISRSKLTSRRGRYLGEGQLEEQMEAEGYRIFHPQGHSFEEQIAQYKAAKYIVSSDNSALHLAAFFTQPDARVAIIIRRQSNAVNDISLQFEKFAGLTPDVVDVMDGRVFQSGDKVMKNEIYTALDMRRLGETLLGLGFTAQTKPWPLLSEEETQAELVRYQKAQAD